MTLYELLQRCASSAGIQHQHAIQDVRQWLSLHTMDEQNHAIRKIDDIAALKYLQEAGLRAGVFQAYLDHLRTVGKGQAD